MQQAYGPAEPLASVSRSSMDAEMLPVRTLRHKIQANLAKCCAERPGGFRLALTEDQLTSLEQYYRRTIPFGHVPEIDTLSRFLISKLPGAPSQLNASEMGNLLVRHARGFESSETAWEDGGVSAKEMHRSFELIWQRVKPILFDMLAASIYCKARTHLLDIGGGNLWVAKKIRDRFAPDECAITVVDVRSPDKRLLQDLGERDIKYLHQPAQTLAPEQLSSKPDVVFASRAIEYHRRPEHVLQALDKLSGSDTRCLFVHNAPQGIDRFKLMELHGLLEANALLYRGLLLVLEGELSMREMEAAIHQRAESLSEDTMQRIIDRMVREQIRYERVEEEGTITDRWKMLADFESRGAHFRERAAQMYRRWQGLFEGEIGEAETEEQLSRLYLDSGFYPVSAELVHFQWYSYYIHSLIHIGASRGGRMRADDVVGHREFYISS